ncbi:peptidylprolyl isomerase [Ideonella margarita]|uniref:peptidylprolyl isomerase n=1 Tax=Ideonella margarita TaxID=2984191 RepID=A0ABU9C9D1_9BURK
MRVKLTTTAGDIVVQLESSRAPLSSADFLRYVTTGLYQQQAGFYRVVREDNDRGSPPIQVIQGGLLDENRELPPVTHEPTSMTGLKHLDGSLSLARGAPGTGGGAAFFICVGDQPGLDAGAARNPDRQGFAVFGRVVSGMDVVRRIHASVTDPEQGEAYVRGQMLKEPVRITRAAVVD